MVLHIIYPFPNVLLHAEIIRSIFHLSQKSSFLSKSHKGGRVVKFCFSSCFLGYLGRKQRLFSLKFYNSSWTLMYVQEMKLVRDAMSLWALSLLSHFSLFHSLVFIHQTKLIVNIAKSVENNRILLPISIIKILLVSRLLTNLIQSKFVAVNLI